ncbi:MAG: UDP-glucose 4-epimerase [Dehalococcoidia bacterium]|nr:MAG: UDP-glucose 4-epimerase [Dehalococcoidia bacterium]
MSASAAAPHSQGESGRALVTGGAGFIGSHLVDHLLTEGWEVVVLDDFSSGRLANLPDHPRLRVMVGDVRDGAAVRQASAGCSVIFHLAAVVGVRRVVADPLRTIGVAVHGTEQVLDAALARRARVVLASTSEVYGLSDSLPFQPDGLLVLGPPTVRRWAYALAKALDEQLLFAYRERGLEGVVLRYFNTYGPRQESAGYAGVVAVFCAAAAAGRPLLVHGDGRQTRCFCYVEDTVRATYRAAVEPAAEGNVFNLGTTEEVTIRELAQEVVALAERPLEVRFVPFAEVFGPNFQDPPRRLPDTRRAEEVLAFRPQTPLREGLARTLAWARAQHALAGGS